MLRFQKINFKVLSSVVKKGELFELERDELFKTR